MENLSSLTYCDVAMYLKNLMYRKGILIFYALLRSNQITFRSLTTVVAMASTVRGPTAKEGHCRTCALAEPSFVVYFII